MVEFEGGIAHRFSLVCEISRGVQLLRPEHQLRECYEDAEQRAPKSRARSSKGEGRMGRLDGKVAIVTGAARGLGRAYAKRLAGLGAKLAVADLDLRSYEKFETEAQDMTGETTVAEIEASGGTALGIEVDVRDNTAVEAMLARILREWGRIDVLVANAGGGRGRPMDTKASSLDPALLHLVTEMNLFGTVYSCSAVAPIMKQQRSGKIITVSSIAGTAHPLMAGTLITEQRKPPSPITRDIWRRISGHSGSPQTVSPLV